MLLADPRKARTTLPSSSCCHLLAVVVVSRIGAANREAARTFDEVETLFDIVSSMGPPKRPPPAPRGLSFVPERVTPWARRYSAWRVVVALIRGRWRLAVLRGWAAPDSGTWYAALEFKYVKGDPVGTPGLFEDGEAGPIPDDAGVVRGWYRFVEGWLIPVREPPPDWTGPLPRPD